MNEELLQAILNCVVLPLTNSTIYATQFPCPRCAQSIIQVGIRNSDYIVRFGGDEFLVLILGLPEGDARLRLGHVNERLRAVELPDGQTVAISVSMGFAAFDSAESLDDVIRVADTAMYGVKRG